jgi:predicted metal-binding membrane protein
MRRSYKQRPSRHEQRERVAGFSGWDIGTAALGPFDQVDALYRPHGSSAAGAVAIAAGVYEFTPLKQHFRRRCRESVRSGFGFGLYCVGSSIGLMLTLVALSVMSVAWMSAIAALVLAQKLLPARAAIDVPLALAIVGLGIVIVFAPSSIPGLTPPT